MADGITGKIKSIYYSYEDKYYEFLDKLEAQKIPVYKVVDPIDKVFPSFLLLLILLALFLFAFFIAALAVVFPDVFSSLTGVLDDIISGIFGGSLATFLVLDNDGNPLSGVQVALTFENDTTESFTTDAFGEFSVQVSGSSVFAEVKRTRV